MLRQKLSLHISPCPHAPIHRILILIIRMLLIVPPFLLNSFQFECDLILRSFPRAFSIARPPTVIVPIYFLLCLTAGFSLARMLANELMQWHTSIPIVLLPTADYQLQLCSLTVDDSKIIQVI